MSAVRSSQRQGRTVGEAFTHNGVESIVNSVPVPPQKLHHRVIGLAEGTVQMLVTRPVTADSHRQCVSIYAQNQETF